MLGIIRSTYEKDCMKLFYRLPETIASIYKGKNILWQFLAVAATYAIVATGFDWYYFQATRDIPTWIFMPAVALGGILPIIVPLCILAFGAIRKSVRTIMTGWAIGQAALVGFLISCVYKAFTGRIPPPETFSGLARATVNVGGTAGKIIEKITQAAANTATDAVANTSGAWQFGFLRGGVFWGWPSSHTMVASAMGAAIFALFPDHKYARWLGLVWALYVGLSISVSIHWFSEFVAGAIMGTVVGLAIGKAFLAYTRPATATKA